MTKIMLAFGTRPEAVKMCPLVKELKKRKKFDVIVLTTGQHREMLSSVMSFFGVRADYDLDIMEKGQSLFDITEKVLLGMRGILEKEKPDLLLVHGDTTTAFASALAAFYLGIRVGHVEAGLRTYDISAPFPEEFNRTAVDAVSSLFFAPSKLAGESLMAEGKNKENIFVTGNTGLDALKYTVNEKFSHPVFDFANGRRIVLLTAHRRENAGDTMKNMFEAIKSTLSEYDDVCAVYPVHPSPSVSGLAHEVFDGFDKVMLIPPLDVFEFHNLMARSFLVLTDSGGIQEEAPSLGVPVLVMRNTTEREEAVSAGTVKLCGNSAKGISEALTLLLDDEETYKKMARAENPYGDGNACSLIADILEKIF